MESRHLLPKAPTGLTASNVTSTSVDLTWDAVTFAGGIQEYRIYQDGAQVGTATETSYTASGLTSATSYTFEVTAVGSNGEESAKSESVDVTTS